MAYEYLKVSMEGRIALVTIDRQVVLNALNTAVVRELQEFFDGAVSDDAIGAILLTGAGEKAFVAGADIAEMRERDPQEAKQFSREGQRLTSTIESLPKPVIAAVNGYALGGGTELALACHLRFASENAMFGLPEVSLGIFPGWGGTQRLPRLIGRARATEMIISAEKIDAETAREYGLVNRIFPHDELLTETEKFAGKVLKNGPTAVEMALEAIRRGNELSLDEGLEVEADLFGLIFTTEDMREGTTAFVEKREPDFKGK